MKQQIIRFTQPYHDGLFSANDLVSKAYVGTVAISKPYIDSENAKQASAIADKPNRNDVFIKDNSGNLHGLKSERNRETKTFR